MLVVRWRNPCCCVGGVARQGDCCICLLPGWKLQSIFLAVTQPKAMAPALSVGVKWAQMPCCDEQAVEIRLAQSSRSGSMYSSPENIHADGRELSKLAGRVCKGRGVALD